MLLDDQPYKCEQCDKTFKHKGHYKDHMLKHTGEKTFSCSFCTKTFARLYSVKCHEARHVNEKKFKCTECDKSFNVKNTLWTHMKSHSTVGLYFNSSFNLFLKAR